jgi:carbamoyl-phosphate synthase large subunit
MIFDTILLTGCGGDIARSISQIIHETKVATRVIGCDVRKMSWDSAIFDFCEFVPCADDPSYFDRLVGILRRHDVDAVVPLSDMEIRRFLNAGFLHEIEGRAVIAANPLAVQIGLDKFETNQMLVNNQLPAPWTRIVGKGEPLEFPCIVKPRFGQGSKGIQRIQIGDVAQHAAKGSNYVWQELILPDSEEYTCGVFGTASGEVRTITFRRQLRGSATAVAEVAEVESIERLLTSIASAVQLRGSINVQLRLSSKGPMVFEINPRFSSTVEFRNRLGFRDFIWSLMERKTLKIEPYVPPPVGITLYRENMEMDETSQQDKT